MPVQIYLQCEDLKGSVTTAGFEEHIQVDSVNFKTHRENANALVSGGSKGNIDMGHFSITKKIDKAAVSTLKSNTSGMVHKELKIKFIRPAKGGKIKPFLEYVLNDVYVVDYELNAGEEYDDPVETVSFGYTKLTLKYSEADQRGILQGQEVMSYSLKKGSTG